MSTIDEMWAALEAHKPKRGYAKAWATMLKERTTEAVWDAYDAAPAGSAAAVALLAAVKAAEAAEWADEYAQPAIDALKREVKP